MKKAYLGIDYGRKRIGLAISENGVMARPLLTMENRGERKNLIGFRSIIASYNIGTIVVGLPVHQNTSMADEVREFAKGLETLGVEIVFQNEMLTSIEAEAVTRDKKLIDSIAATMILNDYLKGETNGL
jgi:putative Holliday junction resolvase